MSHFVFYFGYLYVGCSGSIASVGEEGFNLPAIVCLRFSGSCLEVGFFFLLVFRTVCVILLWHSLGLPFN